MIPFIFFKIGSKLVISVPLTLLLVFMAVNLSNSLSGGSLVDPLIFKAFEAPYYLLVDFELGLIFYTAAHQKKGLYLSV